MIQYLRSGGPGYPEFRRGGHEKEKNQAMNSVLGIQNLGGVVNISSTSTF